MKDEPTSCYFCDSYDMYQGSFELIEGEMQFVCVDCLKKKLGLQEYGFPKDEEEKEDS